MAAQVDADCVAAVQIVELRDAATTGEEEKVKYQKMYTIWQLVSDRKSGQESLPSAARIHLVIDIRNHQKPSDFDQHHKLSREQFDRLIAGITSSKAYGAHSQFGKKIINSLANAAGKGSTGAAVLDLYGVYTLLFGTEGSEFSRGLTDEWRAKLNDRLNTTAQKHKASEPIDRYKTSCWGSMPMVTESV